MPLTENAVPVPGFGARVQRMRKLSGLRQADLAAELGRSESWMAGVERGRLAVDSVTMLQRIAAVLRVDVLDLRPDLAARRNA